MLILPKFLAKKRKVSESFSAGLDMKSMVLVLLAYSNRVRNVGKVSKPVTISR